jgi:CelD/BcsL family acetyltransferase involved in cellulose biosynthesis
MNPADCKILTSETAIAALADGWNQLQARVGWNPFTQYSWFDAWWQSIGKPQGWTPHIVAYFKDGRLESVLPLATQKRRGLRRLEWAGAEWFDYCDALAANPATADILWRTARQSPHYDLATIRDVHDNAVSRPALASFSKLLKKKEASYLDIAWPSGEAWLQSMPKKKRGVMRRRTNQMAEQKGPVEFKVITQGPVDDDVLDTLMRQKTDWLKANGMKLLFDQPGGKDMFRRMVKAAAKEGELLLGQLTVGGALVACHLCYVRNGTLYSYQSSFELSWSNYSPGTVLLMNMVCYAADHGIKRFDHTRGAYAYKDKYSSGDVPLCDYSFSRSMLGKLAEHAMHAKAKWQAKKSKQTGKEPETSDQD